MKALGKSTISRGTRFQSKVMLCVEWEERKIHNVWCDVTRLGRIDHKDTRQFVSKRRMLGRGTVFQLILSSPWKGSRPKWVNRPAAFLRSFARRGKSKQGACM
jgi:hypothetical protein